ncbi:alcohol oxidase [Fomitiporia mediterranea MF3/22]|uniref:alcohol oxidase n=1 Tax=Fomitiporia mediterranea (strain MF3/22) TaxID=694068 RepID=UPI000440760F|nr:alcohol oxidase [Fomitiporia mediterranea MF3/22]EJD00303.1 alcohol oxidase [Fomitiporia mediterranea MF3/22]
MRVRRTPLCSELTGCPCPSGGAAGCVVAGRLAYADPSLQVVLIEGGNNNRDDPWVYRPGIHARNTQFDGINDMATFYTDTLPSKHLRGRQSIVPCANILGGGSSINTMVYTRASASDYDDFKTEGWTANDLMPLMKRIENYQKPCNNDTHGYDGPIAISNGGQINPLAYDFLRAADAVGVPITDDLQDLNTSHASEVWAKYINRETGRRSDAATAYVHSVMDVQTNLHLRTNSKVSRVIFEGNKAVGVAYIHASNRAHKGEVRETIVRARKMVVLSSGSLGNPQILERSGVGNSRILQGLDVKVVSDLPGVGEHYQDHSMTVFIFRASIETETADDFMRGDEATQEKLFTQWDVNPGAAVLSGNSPDAGFKIRPTEEELKEMGTEFNERWNQYFKDKPDKPIMYGLLCAGAYADHSLLPPGKYFSIISYLEYPASRGKIHIQSTNPYKEPFFDSGFMNDKADFAPIRWSYKKTREVARRMNAFRGELTSHHPHFHPVSPAAARDLDIMTAKQILPKSLSVGIRHGTWHRQSEPYNPKKVHEDIKYTAGDDKAIDDWIADHVETTWHSLGTCAMKLHEQGGVVDKRLSVYGTGNLKCVDLSICPDNLGTNTYSAALLIGEKGADLIAEELGLKLRLPHAQIPHAPVPSGRPETIAFRLR